MNFLINYKSSSDPVICVGHSVEIEVAGETINLVIDEYQVRDAVDSDVKVISYNFSPMYKAKAADLSTTLGVEYGELLDMCVDAIANEGGD